jgi:hypothetical protein
MANGLAAADSKPISTTSTAKKTQERRDHGQRRADPEWNRVTADNDPGVLEQADNMAQRNGPEEQRCDS